jgi:hypothetical protein
MFSAIFNFIQKVRIDNDFPRYEKKCRVEHTRIAESRFVTQDLENERLSILEKIQTEVVANFKGTQDKLKIEKNNVASVITQKKKILQVFIRNYSQELDYLYTEKKSLYGQKENLHAEKSELNAVLTEAFESKNCASKELTYYKDRISAWYNKSDRHAIFLGNRGRELPKHSFFGQSMGDLDSYKYKRDKAYNDMQESRNEISRIKDSIQDLNESIYNITQKTKSITEKINTVKSDRTKMFELKKDGYSKGRLENEIVKLQLSMNKKINELEEHDAKCNEFIISAKYKYGVIVLEDKIKEIAVKKAEFLKEFDHKENHALRIKAHHNLWLKKK